MSSIHSMNEVKQLLEGTMLSFNHKLQSLMDGELKVLLQSQILSFFIALCGTNSTQHLSRLLYVTPLD